MANTHVKVQVLTLSLTPQLLQCLDRMAATADMRRSRSALVEQLLWKNSLVRQAAQELGLRPLRAADRPKQGPQGPVKKD